MKLTEISVRRPVTGVMVFACLTIFGLFTFSRLKLDMLPNIKFPMVAVITQYSGAGPDSIEQLITKPIESAMASVQGVEDVNSTSSRGYSLVLVKFAWGSDMDSAEDRVRKNLEIFAQPILPDDAERPLTFAFDPSLQPIVFLTVNAPGTAETARKLAEDVVEPHLSRIPGVAAADVIGGVKREIQVRLRPEWLEAYQVPVGQVVGALRGASVILPGGSVDQGDQELNISTRAEFTRVDQIPDVVVGQRGGVPILLRDVAEVVDGFQEQASVVRTDGAPAVMMTVRKQSDANTVQVSRRVLATLTELGKQLPEGATVTPLFDQGLPITRSISNLSDSALLAIVLTAAVLLAFLRSWRTSLIVLVSIPLSLLVTFAVMDFESVTLNIISMAGLALAVGMLVDNSIVVLENIFTHLQRGEDAKTAAISGTSEMAMPIIASTLTTVVVFAPILFVPGLAGQMFKDMSLTICFSLLASLVVALTLVPLLASLLVQHSRRNWLERLIGHLTFWIDALAGLYGRILRVCLHHKKKVLAGGLAGFVASLVLGGAVLSVDFMSHADDGIAELTIKAAPGTALAESDVMLQEAERIVRQAVPEAEVSVTTVGSVEGIGALFGTNAHTGSLQIRLPSRGMRDRSEQQIVDVLRQRLAALPGLEVKPANDMAILGSEGDISVKIFADDLGRLREYGQRLAARLEKVPGATDISFSMEQGMPELVVDIDREQIRVLGLTSAEVASTVSTYFLGTTATVYREEGEEHNVFVRAPREVRDDLERLRALPIAAPGGTTVPLGRVADIRPALGPMTITRENQERLATVAVTARGVALGTLLPRVEAAIEELGHPDGVTTSIAGTAQDMQESFMYLGIALIVAVLLVYMVMASQFESLLEPFVILATIPLAISGVILALVVTNTTMQVTALIGVILLAGIVVNNGIVLIDVVKQRRLAGEDLVQAAIDGGRSRLRPVLMTALTTIFGMVPLAFEIGDGAEMWAPMARAVIGGMVVSTLLTLVIVPALYVLIAGYADRRKARKRARRDARQAAEAVRAARTAEAGSAASSTGG